MMTQQRLDEAERDAERLGLAMDEATRLRHVALAIAHEWRKHGVPLSIGLECINNALGHFTGNVGIHAAMQTAVEYRKRMLDLYPEWQSITARPITLATLALGVWVAKGWRR